MMACTVSLIISTFLRPHLLSLGLYSLACRDIPFGFETIVVNDGLPDETENICRDYRDKLNLRYIFSGQRNIGRRLKWRIPGYAVNIGVRNSAGEILVISCAEMFHLNNTIEQLVRPLAENPKLLGIPEGKDDREGLFLQYLYENNGCGRTDNRERCDTILQKCEDLNVRLPFLMSVSRREYFEIGGYDEDFTGIAYDDDDLVERLLWNGCSYSMTGARTVHLYHPRLNITETEAPLMAFNRQLYLSRKGKVVRNEGRAWGMLSQGGYLWNKR